MKTIFPLRIIFRRGALLLAAALALISQDGVAAVQSLNGAPSSASVQLGQPAVLSFSWTVTNTVPAGLTTSDIYSLGAVMKNCPVINGVFPVFIANDILYPGPNSFFIQSAIPSGGAALVTHHFTDTFVLPPEVTLRARDAGISTMYFLRYANINANPVEGSGPGGRSSCIPIHLTGSGGAGFSVTREALSFDDDSPVRIVGQNEALQAKARIGFSGAGVLRGVWEVAEPPSTLGEPVFRALSQVQKSLAIGDDETLVSPKLPTTLTGLHLVRLRIIDPPPEFQAPVIRYFVGEGRPGAGLPAKMLALASPAPAAVLAADTAFGWAKVEGAKAYMLEIYATDRPADAALPSLGAEPEAPNVADVSRALARPPVTGMLLPGTQTRTPLSAAVRQRLPAGRTYLWRVLAIGADGAVFAQSPMRELRTW